MRNKKLGFTLLELLIISGIALIALSGLLTLFIHCILLNEANNKLVAAVNDAQHVLEQIKALDYSEIGSYESPDDDILITLEPGLRKTTVTVNVRERISLSTIIARTTQ